MLTLTKYSMSTMEYNSRGGSRASRGEAPAAQQYGAQADREVISLFPAPASFVTLFARQVTCTINSYTINNSPCFLTRGKQLHRRKPHVFE